MGTLRRFFGNVANPLIIVEWVLSIQTLIGGAYLLSPYLRTGLSIVNPESQFLHVALSHWGLWLLGIFALLSALLIIAGIVKRRVRWRSAGLFLNGLARLYAIIGGFAAHGFIPLSWLSAAALMVFCFYIWGRIRKRGVE